MKPLSKLSFTQRQRPRRETQTETGDQNRKKTKTKTETSASASLRRLLRRSGFFPSFPENNRNRRGGGYRSACRSMTRPLPHRKRR